MSTITILESDAVLRDQAALVTGAGRGIGRRIAVGLAAAGAYLALLARSERELADAVTEIEARGGVATAVVADVRDEDKLSSAVDRVRHSSGRRWHW